MPIYVLLRIMRKYIQDFRPYLSEEKLAQSKCINWLSKYITAVDEAVFKRYAVDPTHIKSRHVYAKGFGGIPYTGEALYSLNEKTIPDINKRSEQAQEKIEEIFKALYDGESDSPDHLNHVSCTHYQSPSAAQKIVVSKEWTDQTPVTHLYHMGCYAALPAVRVSKAYIADGATRVDIVHTELCSFHLDKENKKIEQIIMNTLFADGAIKYSVTSEDYFKKSKNDGFEIIAQKEVLIPNSEKEMSWKVGSHNFIMTLTRSVPLILAKKIEKYMRDIFSDAGLDFDKDKSKVIFAVHPGGPKIIDLVERVLKLDDEQVKHSKLILKARGNMSSATIPHIWNTILEDKEVKTETYIATVAFGPGLTMTGAVLKLWRS